MTDENRSGEVDCVRCGNAVVVECGQETPRNHQYCNPCASTVLDLVMDVPGIQFPLRKALEHLESLQKSRET